MNKKWNGNNKCWKGVMKDDDVIFLFVDPASFQWVAIFFYYQWNIYKFSYGTDITIYYLSG